MRKILMIMIICTLSASTIFAAMDVAMHDHGTGVKDKTTGVLLESGTLNVLIYDALAGGNLVYNETFTGRIVNGSWSVLLGENPSRPLSLEFNKAYYKDYTINGEDASFINSTGHPVSRQMFYSPLGEVDSDDLAIAINISGATGYSWNDLEDVPGELGGSGDGIWTDVGGNAVFTEGKVGIGTSLPVGNLDVVANNTATEIRAINQKSLQTLYPAMSVINFYGATSGHPVFSLVNIGGERDAKVATASHITLGALAFVGWDGTKTVQPARIDVVTTSSLATSYAADMRFKVGGQESGAERMRITGVGNVGIGMTQPEEKMHIAGNLKIDEGAGWRDIDKAIYDGISIGTGGQDAFPVNALFNTEGTKMYVFGIGNNRLFQYSLSTPWNVGTAVYDGVSTPVNGQDPVIWGVAFSADGMSFYVLGCNNNRIYQYSLTQAWDISTAAYSGLSYNFGAVPAEFGVTFSADGTSMYLLLGGGNVRQYSLGTAWDVSSVNGGPVSFSIAGETTNPRGPAFSDSGTKMYIINFDGRAILEYSLTTPWDINTASYTGNSLGVGDADGNPQGLSFNDAGTKMYMIGSTNGNVYQYSASERGDALVAGNLGIGTDAPVRNLDIEGVMRLRPRSLPPAGAAEGDIYFDSDLHKPCYYNAAAWLTFDGAACN